MLLPICQMECSAEETISTEGNKGNKDRRQNVRFGYYQVLCCLRFLLLSLFLSLGLAQSHRFQNFEDGL